MDTHAVVAGRMMLKRVMGKASLQPLLMQKVEFKLYISKENIGEEAMKHLNTQTAVISLALAVA